MPRQRVYENNAKKQKAYRRRKKEKRWFPQVAIEEASPEDKGEALKKAIAEISEALARRSPRTFEEWLKSD